jgi:hypothetical protein
MATPQGLHLPWMLHRLLFTPHHQPSMVYSRFLLSIQCPGIGSSFGHPSDVSNPSLSHSNSPESSSSSYCDPIGHPSSDPSQCRNATGILHAPTPVLPPVPGNTHTVTFAGNSVSGPPASACWYAVIMGCTPSDAGLYQDYANVTLLVVGVSGTVFLGGFKKVDAESYMANARQQ